ncbi:AP2/ERF and B3 domain-containing transcription factor At1g50680-like [Momordica charantia]|uniref:AP2/ERF and B3 domain-containing transcription factor At1g50680-like n=1 Tax=Momordica charantia TaxID=3673 RepID=A0A6J1C120_MOMCH|nr:AP2/ERF and B3 domain-containing transcription factor At1g50680-like [Momordica charantia]XP_022135534.1 AP2/ERF and B3 domain-containing transcription factor At1g50680-like [Momordica charantia]XP_022135535.1 AP2/ERF and B3 domain-containing transcription factor At1g50680-like [Momordica charantia]XP_022135536.1 AP2/ERF and B3 domain-containing transcription factor At1g50680-like [Momordica charantia]XP_022135538.1 AP2/ERF and B3 domain-containing transcription factor At1g50680-like [Momord
MMKQEWPSMISKIRVNAIAEGSDSSCITCPFPANGCRRLGRSLTSKFKGVVPQQNGHWGAQIYANHQRIWLGTFKSENDAAMAYDSAAIRIRSGDCHRNFPWTKFTIEEPNFQKLYTTEALLNMLKDGSYRTKFAEYLRDRSESSQSSVGPSAGKMHKNGGTSIKQLFQKELTPSDVGKLNRLVIPKKYAVKYFPPISACEKENEEGIIDDDRDVQLVFFDKMMRQWKFRYCYWKSSQSYVFTRGWNRFVKEKQLRANDTIAFYLCEATKASATKTTFCVVDVKNRHNSGSSIENNIQSCEMQLDFLRDEIEESVSPKQVNNEIKDDAEVKSFKLFGVHIK